MKKRVLKIVTVLAFGIMLFSSCKGTLEKETTTGDDTEQTEKKSNDELKGYMLAGIYTINGYGGIEAVEENVGDSDEMKLTLKCLVFHLKKAQKALKKHFQICGI